MEILSKLNLNSVLISTHWPREFKASKTGNLRGSKSSQTAGVDKPDPLINIGWLREGSLSDLPENKVDPIQRGKPKQPPNPPEGDSNRRGGCPLFFSCWLIACFHARGLSTHACRGSSRSTRQ